MNKFDIAEKIKPGDLLSALLAKKKTLPFHLLKKEINVSSDWKENYLDWGRNALYYFFKSINYKKIAFPAFTCPTLTEAAEAAGKEIELIEIDLKTFNLDISKIPKETKFLVIVHTFGNPVNIIKIRKEFKNLFILEDCAHALFSKVTNEFVGHQGDAIFFSFYKQIVNINGSLLLTKKKLFKSQKQESDFKYLKRLIFKTNGFHQWLLNLKRHQYLPKIQPQPLTRNKPSNLSFKLFEKGFKKLEREVKRRRKIAKWYYQQAEQSSYLIPQKSEPGSNSSYYHFALRLVPKLAPIRDKIILFLRKKNIYLARLWYDAPITEGTYKSYQKKCPHALLLAKSIINLPIYSTYTSKDVDYLFSQLNQAIKVVKNE